jgi:diguanylate cyclase (GGDEF)-like protein
MDRLDHRIAKAERDNSCLAVMFLDLDRFKAVNDTLGHEIGDDLLRVVAQKLQAQVRQSDTVSRLGGDEFVILVDNPANDDEVAYIAGRVLTVINEPMEFRGKVAQVGTSIGIAMFPRDGNTPVELIKRADAAMYAAKDSGRNTYRFFKSPTGSA